MELYFLTMERKGKSCEMKSLSLTQQMFLHEGNTGTLWVNIARVGDFKTGLILG